MKNLMILNINSGFDFILYHEGVFCRILGSEGKKDVNKKVKFTTNSLYQLTSVPFRFVSENVETRAYTQIQQLQLSKFWSTRLSGISFS